MLLGYKIAATEGLIVCDADVVGFRWNHQVGRWAAIAVRLAGVGAGKQH